MVIYTNTNPYEKDLSTSTNVLIYIVLLLYYFIPFIL